jgi:K+-sensing histidine kinase KdpD
MRRYLQLETIGYLAGVLGVLAVALLLAPFYPDVRVLTAANSLLIVVLLVALTWGMRPAFLASFLAALYLNYYYVPPLKQFDFHVDGTEDIIGLVAFMITSIAVGQLSLRLRQRAEENKGLYDQLRATFDRTSQLEAIKRSEALKSALLDTVTHDLRTPLTSIKAAATAVISLRKSKQIAGSGADAAEDSLLSVVVQQADRLNRFIEGMIEMATIDAGGAKNAAGPIAVDEAVGDAIERAADALQEHSIVVECQDDFMAAVNAKAVTQVVFSLLENAGKYSPPGSIVRVSAERCGEGIQISVEDEGPGIPQALRERVFDKFFRGQEPGAHGARVSGLGLGLTIARGIVVGQNGRIWVEERKGQASGARFVFTLPLQSSLQANAPGPAVLREIAK